VSAVSVATSTAALMGCATVQSMSAAPSTFYPRVFASVTAVVLGFAVLRIMQPFVAPLPWAGVLPLLLFPAHQHPPRRLRRKAALAAMLLTLGTVLMVVMPAVFLGVVFGRQASELIDRVQSSAAQHQIQSPSDVLQLPQVAQFVQWVQARLPIDTTQLRDSLVSAGQQVVQAIVSVGGSLFASALGLVVAIVLALFLLFFFLRDGEAMVSRAMAVVPMPDHRKHQLTQHLANVIRAIVLGSLVVALTQGTLVGFGFALAGLPSPIVFGVLATCASLIPFIGTALVWVPGALYLGLTGHWGAALFLAVWSVVVVSSADNLIRPLFISSRAKITTLPVFIGLLGGISAFGAIGIFLGPVVIALVLALFEFAEESIAEQKAMDSAAANAVEPARLP
jgi:predicted PurR-regulated permease PerM